MENKQKNSKQILINILYSLSIVTTVTYFIYTVIKSGDEINQLSVILNVALIAIFSIFFVLTAMSTDKKGKSYAVIGAILLTGYSGFHILSDMNIIHLPTQSYVEDFTNKASVNAIQWAKENDVTIKQVFENSDTVDEYYVINQNIAPGTLTKNVNSLTITVSEGPNLEKEVVIPNMIGWTAEDVLDFIKKNHLSNVEVEFVLSEKTKDTVIEQLGSGALTRNSYIKLVFSIGSETDIKEIKMIDLTEKSTFEATFWLKQHGIAYESTYDYSDMIKKDYIMKQSIAKDKIVNPRTDTVSITISKGGKITVPDLSKMDLTQITEWISQNKLKIELSDRYDESIKVNMPIEVNYKEGDVIEEGTLIKLIISKGKLTMESFSSLTEFKSWADTYGIKYNEVYEFSDSIPQGEVIKYSHNKGTTIKNEDAITVTISNGKKTTIPNFIGKTKSEITKQCNNLNLSCSFLYQYSNSVEKDKAIAQSKTSGTEVSENTFISITLSKGKTPSSSSGNNNSGSNGNNSNTTTPVTPPTPSCDTSKGATFYIAPGSTGSQVLAATKNQNPGFTITANYVDSCPNGATTSGMVCNSSTYDAQWISYCTSISLTIVK